MTEPTRDVYELLRYLRAYFSDHTEQAQRIDAALAALPDPLAFTDCAFYRVSESLDSRAGFEIFCRYCGAPEKAKELLAEKDAEIERLKHELTHMTPDKWRLLSGGMDPISKRAEAAEARLREMEARK